MTRTLRRLHRDETLSFGAMAAQLSAQFGVTLTKNACIGKARRMGLPIRGPFDRERVLKQPRPKMIRLPHKIDAPIEPELETPAEAAEPGISIYQLASDTCRWPLDPMEKYPPLRYCGCWCEVERPYCDTHMRVAHPNMRTG
jgi:hypothetical protein